MLIHSTHTCEAGPFRFLLHSKLHATRASLLRLILSVSFLRDGLPGSHAVTEEFALDWPQVLSGTHNVALAWVDGRSGVGRGQKTTPVDPRKLGSQRVKDYVGVVESVTVMSPSQSS